MLVDEQENIVLVVKSHFWDWKSQLMTWIWYWDGVVNTISENSGILPQSECASCISKGIWTVQLCSSKILPFLTGNLANVCKGKVK